MDYTEDFIKATTYCKCSNFLYTVKKGKIFPSSQVRIEIDCNKNYLFLECKKCGKVTRIPLHLIPKER